MFSGVICGDENFSTSTSNVWGIIIMHVLCCVKRGGYRILEIGTHCVPQFPATENPSAKLEFIAKIVAFFSIRVIMLIIFTQKSEWYIKRYEKFEWIYDHLNSIELRCGCDWIECLTALLLLQLYCTTSGQQRLTLLPPPPPSSIYAPGLTRFSLWFFAVLSFNVFVILQTVLLDQFVYVNKY